MQEYKYNVELESLKSIIKEFNLDKLCPTSFVRDNIAVTISKLYFYQGMIKTSEPKLPSYILRSIYREIILDVISITEAIEFEVGAKLLDIKRKKYNKITDKVCRSATSVISGITSGKTDDELYTQYRELRHTMHLSMEEIEKDDRYTHEEAEKWGKFVVNYIKYLDEKYEYYLEHNDNQDIKERLKLLKGELNY